MDLDAILEDIPENRSSDIGGNAMDILNSVKNGFDIVLKKVADMEKQQNMLLGKQDKNVILTLLMKQKRLYQFYLLMKN